MYKQKYSIRLAWIAHRLFFLGFDLIVEARIFWVWQNLWFRINFSLKLIILVKPYGKNYKSSLLFNSTCASIVNISAWLSARVWNDPEFRYTCIWLENCHKRCRQNTWANYISCKRKINNSTFWHQCIIL